MKNNIDLHIHSKYSDGTLSPKEIVKQAYDSGLFAISITDHDITDGLPEGILEGAKLGLEVVPGIELSVEPGDGTDDEIHILGYYINWENAEFQEKLSLFRQGRLKRAYLIFEKLNKIGIKLDEEKLFQRSAKSAIGRLHIAKALLEAGYISDIKEAFNKYLGPNCPAYVKKIRLLPDEAISLINKVGGVPVLAHPLLGGGTITKIKSLIKFGLIGIEVYYSKTDDKTTDLLKTTAKENGLIITGGSDYHGEINGFKSIIETLNINNELLENLKMAKRQLDKKNMYI